MAKLSEEAKAYEPKQMKNIAELKVVRTDIELNEETFQRDDGSDFTVKVAEIEGERYRVPVSVLKSLKAILEVKPELKTFQVKKTGVGMNTEYTVIPLS